MAMRLIVISRCNAEIPGHVSKVFDRFCFDERVYCVLHMRR